MKHVGIFDYFDEVVSVDDAGGVGKDRRTCICWLHLASESEPGESPCSRILADRHAFRQGRLV